MPKSKILLICNESKTVINFRKELILFLLNNNFNVSVITGDNKFEEQIKSLGVEYYCVNFDNRSINPFSILKTKSEFSKIINQVSPDCVFTFQIKPNIFGTLACKGRKNLKVFNMVEGLGDPFQPKNLKGKIIRFIVSLLYKKAFKLSKAVFFLNNSDKEELVKRNILTESKAVIINGIGIDTSIYKANSDLPKEKRVLNLSRLIKNKGIFEYCEIARIVRSTRKDIIFDLYGEESQLKVSDIKQYIEDGSIYYGGYSTEANKLISQSRILCSTSYREGFPRIILEAMALGRVVVASDVVGNKDAVVDKKTGYLINRNDLDLFAKTIIKLIDDEKTLNSTGKVARKYCVEHYDSNIINNIILKYIND